MKKLEDYVTSIPDFPEPGIIFRDITTILQDGEGLHQAVDQLIAMTDGLDFALVVGPESRGIIFGVQVGYALRKGFVQVRKHGNLPRYTIDVPHEL